MNFAMTQTQAIGLLFLFIGFGILELVNGRFFSKLATAQDRGLEIVVFVLFPLVSVPLIFLSTQWLCTQFMPAQINGWDDLPWWAMLLTLLIADDLTQYWWHRLSHTALLWPLHRAHHSAAYMSVRVVYRNNFFYYALMPGLWFSGVFVYLGFGWVYIGYSLVKMAVIIGAHSTMRWDEPLYRIRLLRPFMWVLERTISTPATHFAHHALTQDDGIGHYKGNYGNLLFFWDVLFGTALITRKYPPAFGLQDDRQHGAERWFVQFLYPIFKSSRAQSVLSSEPVKRD